MKEEAEAEAKWGRLSPEERQKILVELHEHGSILEFFDITPEHENKTWAELEQEIQDAIIQHLFGKPKVETTPTTS